MISIDRQNIIFVEIGTTPNHFIIPRTIFKAGAVELYTRLIPPHLERYVFHVVFVRMFIL